MTKEENQWIYGGIILTGVIFIFLLYLLSNYSPLVKGDPGVDLNQLEDNTTEATSSLKLNFGDTQ